MCGIGALLDPAGTAPSDAGARMTAALRHRGPDGDGVRRLGPATLAHTRLAIIDVAGGDQPLDSEDGAVTAIVNGEIYNHLELRAQLEAAGHRFATHSDCEVVVHGYEEHGTDVVRHLNGIFGFALWDSRAKRLVAARDPFGVKPLYWCSDGRRVALASEIGALLAAGLVDPRVDRVALDHYLACRFVPAPRTLFDGVSKLAPASILIAEEGGSVHLESYREAPGRPLSGLAGEELAGELAERFTDAVERQMMSDVPYGAFLSGGVDSAAIAAAMARRSERPPSTFTIGFPGHGTVLDEREYARESARVIGTDHHDTAMEQADFLGELERSVVRLEEPCGIPSAPALMQLARFTSSSVKVVLSGQGADEPHGGYGRHQAAAVDSGRRAGCGPLASARKRARLMPGNERARRASRLLGQMSDAERLLRLVEITGEDLRSELVSSRGEEAAAERRVLADDVLGDVGDRGLLEQALYLDTRFVLPDRLLICADKMTMSASLEQRVPFLDVELMRFVERIPVRERVRTRQGKRLHRKAMARLLAAARQPAQARLLHAVRLLAAGVARRGGGAPLLERFAARRDGGPGHRQRARGRAPPGRADHKSILYCLLELSEWHRTFVEGEVPVAAGA